MAPKTAIFDLKTIAASFPDAAETMLIDTRLTDEPEASSRVFRVYTPVPAHYHVTCDEYLLVLSGRARLFLGEDEPFEAAPGQLIFFKKTPSTPSPRSSKPPSPSSPSTHPAAIPKTFTSSTHPTAHPTPSSRARSSTKPTRSPMMDSAK